MGIDVHFHDTHITLFPWGLAALAVSALILAAVVIAACEILYRRLRSSGSQ